MFQYVQPTDEQKATMQTYRDQFEALVTDLVAKFPSSRGLSMTITKLEEASFWLNKAIILNDSGQPVQKPTDSGENAGTGSGENTAD